MDTPDAFWPAFGFKAMRLIVAGGRPFYTGMGSSYGVTDYDRLESVHKRRVTWWPLPPARPTDWLEAECSPPWGLRCDPHEHEIPIAGKNNGCGFYAHYRFECMRDLETMQVHRESVSPRTYKFRKVQAAVVGALVLGGGRVQAHEAAQDGFRSQYMKIAGLIQPVSRHTGEGIEGVKGVLGRMAKEMRVPFFDDPGDAEDYGKSIGIDLWPMVQERMRVAELDRIVEGTEGP